MADSFNRLKELTVRAVELRIHDMSEPFTLVTYGSDEGVG